MDKIYIFIQGHDLFTSILKVLTFHVACSRLVVTQAVLWDLDGP